MAALPLFVGLVNFLFFFFHIMSSPGPPRGKRLELPSGAEDFCVRLGLERHW